MQKPNRTLLNGYSTYTDSLGIKYEGQFVKGRFHGKGQFSLPDGTTYILVNLKMGDLMEKVH